MLFRSARPPLPFADNFGSILSQKGFFKSVNPVNFTTVATPHLGQVVSKSFRSKLFAYFGKRFLSRTGEQLYWIDNWAKSGRPLIDNLADPGMFAYVP